MLEPATSEVLDAFFPDKMVTIVIDSDNTRLDDLTTLLTNLPTLESYTNMHHLRTGTTFRTIWGKNQILNAVFSILNMTTPEGGVTSHDTIFGKLPIIYHRDASASRMYTITEFIKNGAATLNARINNMDRTLRTFRVGMGIGPQASHIFEKYIDFATWANERGFTVCRQLNDAPFDVEGAIGTPDINPSCSRIRVNYDVNHIWFTKCGNKWIICEDDPTIKQAKCRVSVELKEVGDGFRFFEVSS